MPCQQNLEYTDCNPTPQKGKTTLRNKGGALGMTLNYIR